MQNYYRLLNRKENFGCGTCSKYLAYSIESQVAGFRIQASVMKSFYRKAEYRRQWWRPFPDKQLALGYWEKSMVESILSKSSASSVLALAPLSLLRLKQVVAGAATTFQLKEKLCNIKFSHWKAETLAEEMEIKLEQYCKGSKKNINSKRLK